MIDAEFVELVAIAESGMEFQRQILACEDHEVSKETIESRIAFLNQSLNTLKNCGKIVEFL